ncbi:MAG: hypothetical protein GF364_12235 [Candidatus Lokiarchaeota archaeon]|nr:hypothetical protein [Candidatus Lokiarchaeota archaeon]
MSEQEDGFSKFEKLASAIKTQKEHISELEYAFQDKNCPFRKEKCIGRDCAWYMICLNSNRKAFYEFLK